jgi:hypothetical protein
MIPSSSISRSGLRAGASRALVRWVSRWIQAAYQANCDGRPRMESFFALCGRRVQWFAFPLARRLDGEAMVDQMIEECWWG